MSRHPQKCHTKGSLNWIQKLINERPHSLDSGTRNMFTLKDSEEIEWVSPLKDDEYAEYRDVSLLSEI